jgi:hypothetical protein
LREIRLLKLTTSGRKKEYVATGQPMSRDEAPPTFELLRAKVEFF